MSDDVTRYYVDDDDIADRPEYLRGKCIRVVYSEADFDALGQQLEQTKAQLAESQRVEHDQMQNAERYAQERDHFRTRFAAALTGNEWLVKQNEALQSKLARLEAAVRDIAAKAYGQADKVGCLVVLDYIRKRAEQALAFDEKSHD